VLKAGSIQIDGLKRKVLKRLQQVAAQLQASPPQRLEVPAAAVERASRQAGYAGSGSPEDLLPPWADAIGPAIDAERENSKNRWAEAAEYVEASEHSQEARGEEEAPSQVMLASALKALSAPKKQAGSDLQQTPNLGLPLGPTEVSPPPGLEQEGLETRGTGAEGRGAKGPGRGFGRPLDALPSGPPLSAGFGIGEHSAARLEKQLLSVLALMEDGAKKRSSEDLAELPLDAEARAVVAQLKELPEDEFTQVVGQLGEKVAAEALRQTGLEVHWVNMGGETGWPFDLIVRPESADPWPSVLSKMITGDKVPKSLKDVEAALSSVPGAALVEVKASLSGARGDVFDISAPQLAAARRLGQRYWLARVRRLSEGMGQVRVLQDVDRAICDGQIKLLMVA